LAHFSQLEKIQNYVMLCYVMTMIYYIAQHSDV
jgi:hypothetical protein